MNGPGEVPRVMFLYATRHRRAPPSFLRVVSRAYHRRMPQRAKQVFASSTDLRRRLDAVKDDLPPGLYASASKRTWWSELSEDEKRAVIDAEVNRAS